MSYLTLVPAYGRDYKSKKEVMADWDGGKDFRICDVSSPDDGRYLNKDNAVKTMKGTALNIRYKRLTMICVVVVK
jgi:hypothetical protein